MAKKKASKGKRKYVKSAKQTRVKVTKRTENPYGIDKVKTLL